MFFTSKKIVGISRDWLEEMIDGLYEPMMMINSARDFQKKHGQQLDYSIEQLNSSVEKINKVYLMLVCKRLGGQKLDVHDKLKKATWLDLPGFKLPEGFLDD